jgi:uncharacterized protein involved in oxidation of intracellular sulfur
MTHPKARSASTTRFGPRMHCSKRDSVTQVTVFLMADAVLAGKMQQKTPDGYYNVKRMLKRLLSSKGSVLLCGTCMDARGISDTELLEGARRSSMDELANVTAEAEQSFDILNTQAPQFRYACFARGDRVSCPLALAGIPA